jgi:hypothetical protein
MSRLSLCIDLMVLNFFVKLSKYFGSSKVMSVRKQIKLRSFLTSHKMEMTGQI